MRSTFSFLSHCNIKCFVEYTVLGRRQQRLTDTMHFCLYVSSHNNFIALALEFCGRPNIHTLTYTHIECIETVFLYCYKKGEGGRKCAHTDIHIPRENVA